MSAVVVYMGIEYVLLQPRRQESTWVGGWTVGAGSWAFLDWVTNHHHPRWLTHHDRFGGYNGICDAFRTALGGLLDEATRTRLLRVGTTRWEGGKARGINMRQNFVWLVAAPLLWDLEVLNQERCLDRMIFADCSRDPLALAGARAVIEEHGKCQSCSPT